MFFSLYSLLTYSPFTDDIPIQDKREEGESKMESISEEGVEGKAKGGLKAVVKLPSLVKKKAAEATRPKAARRKTEPTEEAEEVSFAPENSQGGSEHQAEEFELKQRDSVV